MTKEETALLVSHVEELRQDVKNYRKYGWITLSDKAKEVADLIEKILLKEKK